MKSASAKKRNLHYSMDSNQLRDKNIRKRGKYGRPCDVCSFRRVRCVFPAGSSKCIGCTTHNCECTNNRIRKKLGPKPGRRSIENGEEAVIRRVTSAVEGTSSTLENPSAYTGIHIAPAPRMDKEQCPPDMNSMNNQNAYDNTAPHPSSFLLTPPTNFTPDVLAVPDAFASSHPNSDMLIPSPSLSEDYAAIPIDKLLPCLQVYQTWFYGYWPVLSVAGLMLTLVGDSNMDSLCKYIKLSEENAMSYALCCAVCATILTQVTFVTSKIKMLNINACLPANEYANEAKRVRYLYDYAANPTVLTLLSSFFLYTHYVNVKGKTTQSNMYLREAITTSQILGLHEPLSYVNKSAAEVHRWKKIYYMLLVTERYMCFEDGLPVILDPCIETPSLENEEYPSLLVGFTELVWVFSVPSKEFFGELNQKRGNRDLNAFRHSLERQGLEEKKKWILNVHNKLSQPYDDAIKVSDSQKLNIVLSQAWIQSIAWHITSENGLLYGNTDPRNCFSVEFPGKIAENFLRATTNLPLFAFESNGPGVGVKLLAIAESLSHAIPHSQDKLSMAERLNCIFSLVNRYKNDVALPLEVYTKVANTIADLKSCIPRSLQQIGEYEQNRIEELCEEHEDPELTYEGMLRQKQAEESESLIPDTSSMQPSQICKPATLRSQGEFFLLGNRVVNGAGDFNSMSRTTSSSTTSIIGLMNSFIPGQFYSNKEYPTLSPEYPL